MAALPQNNTDRVFIDYITGNSSTSREHTLAIRKNGATTAEDTQVRFLALLNAFGAASFRVGWRVLRVRLQLLGTDFSIPQLVDTGLAAFVGTFNTGYTPRVEAVEETFQGRSGTSGRRVDISLYRAATDAADNFRTPGGATGLPAVVRAVVSSLQLSSSTVGCFLTIDGNVPTWYDYMNSNYNSYWEARSRTV